MKLKNLFITLGLTLALGLGVGASLGHKEAKQVKASTETTVYYAIADGDVGSYTVKVNARLQGAESGDDEHVKWASAVMTDTGEDYNSKSVYSGTFTADYDGVYKLQFQLYDGDTWKSQVAPIDGTWTNVSVFNGKLWEKGGSEWVDYEPVPTYTVSISGGAQRELTDNHDGQFKLEVHGAMADRELVFYEDGVEMDDITVKPGSGTSYNNVRMVAGVLTTITGGNFDIYLNPTAKNVWVTGRAFDPENDYTLYFGCDDYTEVWAYSYCTTGEYRSLGEWPGTRLSNVEMVNFNGHGLFKVTMSSEWVDDKIIFVNWDSSKEGDARKIGQLDAMDLVAGVKYYVDGSAASAKLGAAAAFVDKVNQKRNAVAAHDDIQAYSICGISQGDAQALVSEYQAIADADIKSAIDAATVYTYNGGDKEGGAEVNYTFAEVMVELARLAGGAGGGSATLSETKVNNNHATLIIVIISATALVAVGGFFLLRKKREN